MNNIKERRTVWVGKQAVGHIESTLGGFWRAYSNKSSIGVGPFRSDIIAECWLREEHLKAEGAKNAYDDAWQSAGAPAQ